MNELHAYRTQNCFCPLEQHLINTVLAVVKTSLSKRLTSIVLRIGGRSKKEFYYNHLLLPFLFHDIGKILEIYQHNKLGYSYLYHEVPGAIITYMIIKKYIDQFRKYMNQLSGVDIGDLNMLKPLITYPVLFHHYSFRDLNQIKNIWNEKFIKYNDYLFVKKNVLKNLLNILVKEFYQNNIVYGDKELEWNLLRILEKLCSIIDELEDKLKFNDLPGKLRILGQELFRIKSNYADIIGIHISSLTGLVNIADYLVAGIERRICNSSRKKGFVYIILGENEINELAKLISRNNSICRNIDA